SYPSFLNTTIVSLDRFTCVLNGVTPTCTPLTKTFARLGSESKLTTWVLPSKIDAHPEVVSSARHTKRPVFLRIVLPPCFPDCGFSPNPSLLTMCDIAAPGRSL